MVAIRAAGKRAHGADVDTHAAFFAGEFAALIRQDHRIYAARAYAKSFYVHAFVANANAAEAQDAARCIVIHQRRPLFLGVVQLLLDEPRVIEAVAECHVLQFALATLVAHRTIEWMIRKQEFQHVLARAVHLLGIRIHHHTFGCHQRARGLQLRHFFHFHQTHAAGGLKREVRVIAERRHFDALALGSFNHQRAGRRRHLLAVQCECD